MNNRTLWLPAPAKVNRFLKVNGRRADGYHSLYTAFQFLELCDSLSLMTRQDGQLYCDTQGLELEDNLIIRAMRLLKVYADVRQGASLRLVKKLPVGGGLGGGSSDAATVLLGLNYLWECHLSVAELARLGRCLGADVPVFIYGQSCYAAGVGDIIHPCDFDEQTVMIIYPCYSGSGEVFKVLGLTAGGEAQKILSEVEVGINDCEQAVVKKYREVGQALAWARQYGKAWITGTGGSIVMPVTDFQSGLQLRRQIPSKWSSWISCLRNRSPLSVAMQRLSQTLPGGRD